MSAKWLGLHHPESHRDATEKESRCRECYENCSSDWPCRCCLTAEIEELWGRIEGTKAVIRVCGFTTSAVVEDGGVFGGLEVVPVANVLAALDGDA